MSDRIPLGEKEDHRREFKSAEALKTPEIVARGVVAMLNADGGEVWVGLREENERAVATEPIPNPEREARRLLDYLVDTIEPSPLGEEIGVDPLPSEDGFVLRVTARPQEGHKPYAFSKKGGWHFVVRIGARVRPMSREELRVAFSGPSRSDGEMAIGSLLEEQGVIQGEIQRSGRDLLWLRLKPTASLDLDLSHVAESQLLTDPARTRNRRVGNNFTAAFTLGGRAPSLGGSGKYLEIGKEGIFSLKVYRDGSLLFQAPLESFWAGPEKIEGLLSPEALLEYPISVFRLASQLFGETEGPLWASPVPTSTQIVAQLALFGLQGWALRAGSHAESWTYRGNQVVRYEEADYVQDKPLIFSLSQIRDEPDNCGFRLILRLYEAFGFLREAIPEEFDQKTGRLILPE